MEWHREGEGCAEGEGEGNVKGSKRLRHWMVQGRE